MMSRLRTLLLPMLATLGITVPAYAQDGEQNRFQADLHTEWKHIKEGCSEVTLKQVFSCAVAFATEDPFHLSIGSLAPQNGVAFGAAFSEHSTFGEDWRVNWNANAVHSFGSSWRVGGYAKMVYTGGGDIAVVSGSGSDADVPAIIAHPVINAYAEATSLDTLFFYGLGPSTTQAGKSVFAMKETLIGGNVVFPINTPSIRAWRMSLIGGLNGRFVSLRSSTSKSTPHIDQLYTDTDASAPGLSQQPGFAQFTEGIRFTPSWIGGHLQPNYLVSFDQFVAGSDAHSSFHRWTIDLNHDIPLYSTRRVEATRERESNGPDTCAQSFGGRCPSTSYSRNRGGTISFRFLLSSSSPSSGSAVPFYFQPTLGGSDLNGNAALPSFDDYRFRGPNILLLQESIEHSLWGPIGVTFQADQGKVALDRGDLDFTDLEHSFAAGITLRAGGFPQVYLMFAFGGGEGRHTIARINTSLLGGGARPSLF